MDNRKEDIMLLDILQEGVKNIIRWIIARRTKCSYMDYLTRELRLCFCVDFCTEDIESVMDNHEKNTLFLDQIPQLERHVLGSIIAVES